LKKSKLLALNFVVLSFFSLSCRDTSIKDLSQKTKPGSGATSSGPVYAYLAASGESLKACHLTHEGDSYIDPISGDVWTCQTGSFVKKMSVPSVSNLQRGKIYQISSSGAILQEVLVHLSNQPTPAVCEGRVNFEKNIQSCAPVERNSNIINNAFLKPELCRSASLYQGVVMSPSGSINLPLGPAGVPATVSCLSGETQAQASLRGGIVSDCMSGSFSNHFGLCSPCHGGTFQDQRGQTSCKRCSNTLPHALSISYLDTEQGNTTNNCSIISASCEPSYSFDTLNRVCSLPGVVTCPAGRTPSGGVCINCSPGTFKSNVGSEACTPCTNNITYGVAPVYSSIDFGLTSNSCSISSSSCIPGFSYDVVTRTCVASQFVGQYTTPPPPALGACDGTVSPTGSLIQCFNFVGTPVPNSNCPAVGSSVTYQSPAGSVDAVARNLLLGLTLHSTTTSLSYNCAIGESSKPIESSNFSTLINNGRVIGTCQSGLSSPFVNGSLIRCLNRVRKMALGNEHACLVTENGSPFCWGRQLNGQVGNAVNTGINLTTAAGVYPSNVAQVCANPSCSVFLTNVTDISASNSHTCALTASGQAHCWGLNTEGFLGDNSTTLRTVATPVAGGLLFSKIEVGINHSCAIEMSTNKIMCWGLNTSGQLGYGTFHATNTNANGRRLLPAQTHYVTTSSNSTHHLTNVHDIASGETFSCAIAGANRQLFCWGLHANGRTGLNLTTGTVAFATPVMINYSTNTPMTNVQKIALRNQHACAIVGSQKLVYCWGNNATNGRLGVGSIAIASHAAPQLISAIPFPAEHIAVGANHTCVSSASNQVLCVGLNSIGQLGYGAHSATVGHADNQSLNFRTVTPPMGVSLGGIGLYSGNTFNCALNPHGTPYCWGSNNLMQLNDSSTTNPRNAPVKMNPL